MKSLITTLLLAITLSSTAFGDDFIDGFEAAKKGDFKTAMKLWRPMAEQGDTDANIFLVLCMTGVTVYQKMISKQLSGFDED